MTRPAIEVYYLFMFLAAVKWPTQGSVECVCSQFCLSCVIYHKFPLYPDISTNSTWIFMKLKTEGPGVQISIPTCLIQVVYPQMATIRHGVVQINKKSLYLCQIKSDFYETLNLSSWGTKFSSQLV